MRRIRSWAAGCVLLAAACASKPPESKDYASKIATARAEKDLFFAKGKDSPIPDKRRAEMLPLAYFPIDPAYQAPASFKPYPDPPVMQIPTSTGAMRNSRKVGALEFILKGQPVKLSAFVDVGDEQLNHLTVMFTDLTTGTETYAAGRYLDLDRNATGIYDVDFNLAYHPYCFYNPSYECPYPPPENRLKIPIRAGEKLKHTEK
jgi:uncharacterized protein (DUF1684 family)